MILPSTTSSSAAGGKKRDVDEVTIHVCDESRKVTKEFLCDRHLLLREMKYFEGYLLDSTGPYDEIDILVHCDMRVFEWLYAYIHYWAFIEPSEGGIPRQAPRRASDSG